MGEYDDSQVGCQSSSEAGSIAWSCNSNSTMVRGWVVWNSHCNHLQEKCLPVINFTSISIGVTPLSSSTLNKVLTKLQTGHTLSAASHSELLCMPGFYNFIFHLFADSVVKLVEPVIVLSTRVKQMGLIPINSLGITAVDSAILTVLYACCMLVPNKL